MFAYVHYVVDRKSAKVPLSFVRKFDFAKYDPTKAIYKVFWNRYIHSIQNERDGKSMFALRAVQEPPAKELWKAEEGDGYYNAFVLRIEDSLDLLIESIEKKRVTLPTLDNQIEESCSTTEDEAALLQSEKDNKKKEEAGIKRLEFKSKRARAECIFKEAKKTRKGIKNTRFTDIETDFYDSEADPELIPNKKYLELQAAYEYLENEKQKVEKKYADLKEKYDDLVKRNTERELEVLEVTELRILNRQLQEKFLEQTGKRRECLDPAQMMITETGDSETMEVQLGAGISMNRDTYQEICNSDHVRKFTKSLAVAIWGTPILATRSVKGKPCRNRNGPKKVSGEVVTTENLPPKPPLTPEKLLVISGQMREYLMKRGRDAAEIEKELKNRNKYISDKIQDIKSNMARSAQRMQ